MARHYLTLLVPDTRMHRKLCITLHMSRIGQSVVRVGLHYNDDSDQAVIAQCYNNQGQNATTAKLKVDRRHVVLLKDGKTVWIHVRLTVGALLKAGAGENISQMAHGADGDPDEILHQGERLGLGHLLMSPCISYHVPCAWNQMEKDEPERPV